MCLSGTPLCVPMAHKFCTGHHGSESAHVSTQQAIPVLRPHGLAVTKCGQGNMAERPQVQPGLQCCLAMTSLAHLTRLHAEPLLTVALKLP